MRTYFVAVAAVIALLVGCTPSEPQPSASPTPTLPVNQTPTPSPSPTPTPTPSPTPTVVPSFPADLPTEDLEVAAIISGWQEYWRVFEKLGADPDNREQDETQHVTTGQEATMILLKLDDMRAARIRTEGGYIFRNVQVVMGDKKVSPRKAMLTYCLDRTGLLLFNMDTGAQVPAQGTLLERVTMQLMPDGSWRVESISNESKPC